jgi:hypothetical protein
MDTQYSYAGKATQHVLYVLKDMLPKIILAYLTIAKLALHASIPLSNVLFARHHIKPQIQIARSVLSSHLSLAKDPKIIVL